MAKEIIKVAVKTQKAEIEKVKADMLVVGVFSDKKKNSLCEKLDTKLGGAIKKRQKLGDFDGKSYSTSLIYTNGKIAADRILLVGLGENKKATVDVFRKATATAANQAVTMKAKTMVIALHQSNVKLDVAELGQVITEGIYFGSYRYDEFVTGSLEARAKQLKATIVESKMTTLAQLSKGCRCGNIIGKAQNYARTISNRPGNVVWPATLAAEAQKIAKGTGNLSCTVLNESQLKAKGLGGILAVGSGSIHKPKLIVLKYSPAGKSSATIGLVGKAVTFDSGGISIKPSQNMDQMKLDKSGGVAVLAAMKAIEQLKPKITVYGIIPSAENMPSASSYRPGDIISTYSGKTVEVQNTDAEGRMILCDGLHYAVRSNCEIIIDVATLTGACMVALGKYKAGVMGNDDKLIKELQKASDQSGEPIWPMPSGDEYLEEMKSPIADLKNIGSRWGGACTAAAFLGQFVDDKKWAHIDIAGMDLFESAKKFTVAGSSGFGVRLLTSYVMNLVSKK